MKKTFLIGVCMVAFMANSYAQSNLKGEKGVSSIGVMAGYAIESEKVVVGIDYRYNILDKLRLTPSVLYGIKRNNADIWYLNADAHYLARISENFTLYPIGGLGFSFWKYRMIPDIDLGDIDLVLQNADTYLRIGLNMGIGGELRLTEDIIAGAEFKYNWTKQGFNQAMILVRAAYYF